MSLYAMSYIMLNTYTLFCIQFLFYHFQNLLQGCVNLYLVCVIPMRGFVKDVTDVIKKTDNLVGTA